MIYLDTYRHTVYLFQNVTHLNFNLHIQNVKFFIKVSKLRIYRV